MTLTDAARSLTDHAADNVRTVADQLLRGRATIDDLVAAVDVLRDAEAELSAILALRLEVNGRRYVLRRSVGNVRGEA